MNLFYSLAKVAIFFPWGNHKNGTFWNTKKTLMTGVSCGTPVDFHPREEHLIHLQIDGKNCLEAKTSRNSNGCFPPVENP